MLKFFFVCPDKAISFFAAGKIVSGQFPFHMREDMFGSYGFLRTKGLAAPFFGESQGFCHGKNSRFIGKLPKVCQ